ncbi:NADH kinase isoform X2 [Diospyros lotus]|uniref:NADH kinase isoform X2 n=1 Tax=Diospyros lotus TaxID=55363 RepID=UPI00224EF5F4|nr:NADH kinase isoform X2 [Diospyros lotus]
MCLINVSQRKIMARRRLLLLLKPWDAFTSLQQHGDGISRTVNTKVLSFMEKRYQVHKDAVNFCQDILQKKNVEWQAILCSNLSQPIHDVDLVVTVGGDGTLLQASRFMDDSVPVLGVNSDPTQTEEVEEFSNDFDARRSTGYLCAATVRNFKQYWFQILDNILEGHIIPSKLSRMSIYVNSELLSVNALNDALIAHPCPAAVTWFSFRIRKDGQPCSPMVNCKSSGLRVSTAAGSTAAMLSAGGFAMPIVSKDLQYMVREPMLPRAATASLLHGIVRCDESMSIGWFSEEGMIYIDGSQVVYSVRHGDTIELSSNAPVLNIFLPNHLLLKASM